LDAEDLVLGFVENHAADSNVMRGEARKFRFEVRVYPFV